MQKLLQVGQITLWNPHPFHLFQLFRMRRLKVPVWDTVVRHSGVGDMNLSEPIERAQIGVIFISSESDYYSKAAPFFLREQRNPSQKNSSFPDIRLDPRWK